MVVVVIVVILRCGRPAYSVACACARPMSFCVMSCRALPCWAVPCSAAPCHSQRESRSVGRAHLHGDFFEGVGNTSPVTPGDACIVMGVVANILVAVQVRIIASLKPITSKAPERNRTVTKDF